MAPRAAAIRQTCCCFNTRIATTALAIYHVVSVRVALGAACVCVCERDRERKSPTPQLLNPLEREDRCSPPLRRTPAPSLPCSGPWGPSLSKVRAGSGVWGQGDLCGSGRSGRRRSLF